ncbi:adenosine deaminase [Actinobaculum massiliense]|uniref:Adenosine deaminase n=1 Tax=Actinobaculum massiliense ACS-171-V-Col2 TaxID=883066 RepID=K9EUW4_9ACTO|nr:adenosine deaminase [Actinobaculum massiliense]EKU94797.1 adenosine deaminase [Actinobaculum massiliense ACS-171-V-Col2]MDK8318965.1 adenosine deaminase [Actinobaculum massiliense]MDK8567726.1 adenosine deaminase [Actinobaculum massiliense]
MRDLQKLPKAHLHLHFTGSLSVPTLEDLARRQKRRLPDNLTDNVALHVPADQRGWFRFQRSYDSARTVVRSEEAMRRIVREAAKADAAEGSRRLEIQIDPTSYAPFVGGITPALEIVLDEAVKAQHESGVEMGVIVAASRTRHPMDARTLARLAARYAGDGPGQVIGFGLSNDERRGEVSEWGPAFRIACRAGLKLVPHGGELLGAQAIWKTLEYLHPDRIGHGIRAVEDPRLLEVLAERGIALEVCPASNVSLGVFSDESEVPLRIIFDAGIPIALSADDPLLFLSRLTDQYETARNLGFSDEELAELARESIRASFAAESSKRAWLSEVDAWLANEPITSKPAMPSDCVTER